MINRGGSKGSPLFHEDHMTKLDEMCAEWRAASDGSYFSWEQLLALDGCIMQRERAQMRAVIEKHVQTMLVRAFCEGTTPYGGLDQGDIGGTVRAAEKYAARIVAEIVGDGKP